MEAAAMEPAAVESTTAEGERSVRRDQHRRRAYTESECKEIGFHVHLLKY